MSFGIVVMVMEGVSQQSRTYGIELSDSEIILKWNVIYCETRTGFWLSVYKSLLQYCNLPHRRDRLYRVEKKRCGAPDYV